MGGFTNEVVWVAFQCLLIVNKPTITFAQGAPEDAMEDAPSPQAVTEQVREFEYATCHQKIRGTALDGWDSQGTVF
jgi:hypothetical protein